MHEMSIAEGIVVSLEESAKQHQFTRVKKVWVEVGRFSGVEIDSLRFAWDVVTRDSLVAGAELDIIEITGIAWCFTCGENKPVANRYDPCPTCGGHQMQVVSGNELKIKEIEVE